MPPKPRTAIPSAKAGSSSVSSVPPVPVDPVDFDAVFATLVDESGGNSLFLGSEGVLDKVVWKKRGNKDTLFMPAPSAGELGDGSDEGLMTEAILSLVGVVDPWDKFYLVPSGSYWPDGKFDKGLSTSKCTCNITKPTINAKLFRDSWTIAEKNAIAIQKKAPRLLPNFKNFWTVPESIGASSVRLTHSLFEAFPTDKGIDKDEVDEAMNTIRMWPFRIDLREHVGRLVEAESHFIVPLNALDINGDKIEDPAKWATAFKGALVEVHFGLEHFPITESKLSSFNAPIRQISVLALPEPSLSGGHRNKHAAGAILGSPKKKMKTS